MKNVRANLPSTRALAAFESAARLTNFSHAAEELNTSQSAISRHIADLEARLGVRLFHRERRAVRLTEQGAYLYRAVISGLDTIQNAISSVSNWSERTQLTLACTHEISHLVLMPRFERLRDALGEEVELRVMILEYDALEAGLDPRIDIVLSYDAESARAEDHVAVLHEAIRPVCAPAFAKAEAETLAKPIADWIDLPFLDVTKFNQGWATWDDWFQGSVGYAPSIRRVGIENYLYLLEAAAAGKGLALGWRGLVDRHLESGTLVCVTDDYVHCDRALYAVLTRRGRDQAVAHACLSHLASDTPQPSI